MVVIPRLNSKAGLWMGFLSFFSLMVVGCHPHDMVIPDILEDHPAQGFYQFVAANLVSDRVCRDHKGDPSIPMGKVADGDGYTRTRDLTSGAFLFRDNSTQKQYLGVTYLQYQGFLQVPKLCAWEET
ncbi:MAG TPA: hypothetical protein PLK73_00805 [Candidatus Omnitrophota bacterium]|nr:hypothetical protein [Candidatus Omnitrophota bacterium]